MSRLKTEDYLILLDEKVKHSQAGSLPTIWKKMSTSSGKRIVFLVGGAYGFHESIYSRANDKISLSAMTFSHQLIRQIFWNSYTEPLPSSTTTHIIMNK